MDERSGLPLRTGAAISGAAVSGGDGGGQVVAAGV